MSGKRAREKASKTREIGITLTAQDDDSGGPFGIDTPDFLQAPIIPCDNPDVTKDLV